MIQGNLFTKQQQTHRLKRKNLWLPRRWMRGKDSQGIWDGHAHPAMFKMDNQQGYSV